MVVLVTKDPKARWCHFHLQWECWWIDGISEPVGAKDLRMGFCHNKATEKKPWCKEHKP